MDTDTQRKLLLAQISSMLDLLTERTGVNPFVEIDMTKMEVHDLASLRRQIHEILYAPPSRNR